MANSTLTTIDLGPIKTSLSAKYFDDNRISK